MDPGFRPVPEQQYRLLYGDQGLLEPITAAEAVRIAAEFRKRYPSGLPSLAMYTAVPNAAGQWIGWVTSNMVTPAQIPERITLRLHQGEDLFILRMYCSTTSGSFLDVIKGQDDWWWALYTGNTTRRSFRCDQLTGLAALIRHIPDH